MRFQHHCPWYLQLVALALGFFLATIVVGNAIPISGGIVGIAIYALTFVAPFIVINWLYFKIGKD